MLLATDLDTRYSLLNGHYRLALDRLTFFSAYRRFYQPNFPSSVNALESSSYLYDFAIIQFKYQELKDLNEYFKAAEADETLLTKLVKSITDAKFRNRKHLQKVLNAH